MRNSNPTRRTFVTAVMGSAGAMAGCTDSAPNGVSQVAVQPDQRISYGAGEHQFGELRIPKDAGPHPVLVVIHGGFWRSGFDLRHLDPFCSALTEAGWATWSIEYRRIGNEGGGWPGTFHDVAAATDKVRDLAGPHSLDLKKVVVVGHSSGGHLALWVGGRKRIPADSALYSKSPLPLKGAVSLAGVCDLKRAWQHNLGGGVVNDLIGGSPEQFPDRYAAGSPYELLPLGLHQVLVHGQGDVGVPVAMSEAYEKRAVELGDSARLVAIPDTGHFELINPGSRQWPQIVDALAMLQ